MKIGQRLRALREARGLTAMHIVEKTGFARSYISRVECGHTEPTIPTLVRWLGALGLSLSAFFAQQKRPRRRKKT
jgi:transcriptional regulator with XRE-family HTH domain